MERISDPNLKAYIVWLPMLPSAAHEPAARREAERIPDSRAIRFFDADARVGKVYSSILHLPSGLPAWDVYLVFGPEVQWEADPPTPTYWMHQLGRAAPPELRLDGEQLARVISGLLRKIAGAAPRPAHYARHPLAQGERELGSRGSRSVERTGASAATGLPLRMRFASPLTRFAASSAGP
jgi:hypothetical protein